MNDALKLKDNLVTNVPMTLKIKKLIGSYPDKDFKTKEPNGKTIFLYVFTGSLDGKEYKHYCTEHENELIAGIGVGGIVQVTRTEKAGKDGKRIYPLQWSVPGSAEAVAAPQIKSTSSVVAEERKQVEKEDAEAQKWHKIDLSKILFGYMIEAYKLGNDPDKCAEDAKALYRAQSKAVEDLLLEEKLAAPSA